MFLEVSGCNAVHELLVSQYLIIAKSVGTCDPGIPESVAGGAWV